MIDLSKHPLTIIDQGLAQESERLRVRIADLETEVRREQETSADDLRSAAARVGEGRPGRRSQEMHGRPAAQRYS